MQAHPDNDGVLHYGQQVQHTDNDGVLHYGQQVQHTDNRWSKLCGGGGVSATESLIR